MVRRMNAHCALSSVGSICVMAVLAGCGVSSSGAANSSEGVFVASANGICADFNARSAALSRLAGRGIETLRLEREHALRESELSGLRGLSSAPGQRRAYAVLLGDLASETKLSIALVGILKAHNYQGYLDFQAATELGPPLAVKTKRDAAALRLNQCAAELVFSRPAVGG